MTKQQTYSPNDTRYLITPSLLNAWLYIWNCADNVREAQSDATSFEDKVLEARNKAKEDFINTLNRLRFEPNEYMIQGMQFEDDTQAGKTIVSPIVEGGAWQIVGMKNETINGMHFLLYGRLDVLKGGVVYDIKRAMRYSPPKYAKTAQHPFYLHLFKRAYKFTYLVFDGKELHTETYYPDEVVDILALINNFIEWLKQNELLEIYKTKWKAKED